MIQTKNMVLSASVLGMVGLPLQAAAFSILFDVKDPDIQVGERLDVEVIVEQLFEAPNNDPFEELLGFGFDVTTSNAGIAAFAAPASIGANFDDFSLVTGLDVAGLTKFGSPIINDGLTSSVSLATLSFDALSVGSVDLGIASPLWNDIASNQGLLYLINGSNDLTDTFSVTVNPRADVPLPGTFVLLGAGLLGFAAGRERPATRGG